VAVSNTKLVSCKEERVKLDITLVLDGEEAMEQLDDAVKLNLRLDEALHRQLTAEAKRSVRSLNGEIIFRLRKSLDQPEAIGG